MVENDNNELEWTSISVQKPILRWVSRIKSLIEYIRGKKITNNEALAFICAIADHKLATDYGLTKDNFGTFLEKKYEELAKIDSKEELEILFDDMRSFGLIKDKK